MFEVTPTSEILARAIDVSVLRQAVHTANLANANVDGYRRLEVQFDAEAMRSTVANARKAASADATPAQVVTTQSAVELDQEMAAMAQNAIRHQMLLGLYERSLGTMRAAIHEGRQG